MLLRIFTISFFIVFLSPEIKANENDSLINLVFTKIYNQQFDEAEKILQSKQTEIEPYYFNILEIDLNWWRYSISRSNQDAENLKSVLSAIENPSKNIHPNKIIKLIRKSYELRYERKRYNLFAVLRLKSEINELLVDIKKAQIPLSGEQLKLFNLYVAMFQYFEFINPFSLFVKPEERLVPLQKMEEYAEENDFILNTLAHYFLGRIYQKVERDPQKAKIHFDVLVDRFPQNELFREYAAECAAKN